MRCIAFSFLLFVLVSCHSAAEKTTVSLNPNIESQKRTTYVNLSIVVKTKFDSDVTLEYIIAHHSWHNFEKVQDSLNKQISEAILDSVQLYTMYDMWSSKRYYLEKMIESIVKHNIPKTDWVEVRDVIIPEEAEKQFLERERERQEIMEERDKIYESRKLLTQKLESNKDFSKSEIKEIEKEINTLDNNWTSVQKKAKLLTLNFNL